LNAVAATWRWVVNQGVQEKKVQRGRSLRAEFRPAKAGQKEICFVSGGLRGLKFKRCCAEWHGPVRTGNPVNGNEIAIINAGDVACRVFANETGRQMADLQQLEESIVGLSSAGSGRSWFKKLIAFGAFFGGSSSPVMVAGGGRQLARGSAKRRRVTVVLKSWRQ